MKKSRVDISTLGAAADGITDNSSILQQALDNYDSVFIPQGFKCAIEKTILLHSKNVLFGQDSASSVIVIDADKFKWDNTWNPAAIVNDGRKQYAEKETLNNPNTSISVLSMGFRLHGDTTRNMKSILRFSNVQGVDVEGCNFLVEANGLNHNAIIDLHAAYSHVRILKNNFVINTNSMKSGGAIWVQNCGMEDCSDVTIEYNNFVSSGKDETLGIYTEKSNFRIANVKLEKNHFTISASTPTNNSAVTVYGSADSITIRNNNFLVLSSNKTIDGVIRLGLWHDRENAVNLIRNVDIDSNVVEGNLDKSFGIRGYSGNSVNIRKNIFKGRSGPISNAVNPPADSLQSTWKIQ